MSNYKKLQNVLTEVFQLDQADLDFGIYRIMNQKRDAINDFLQNSLPTQVKELLAKNNTGENVKIQADLDTTINVLKENGVDWETSTKVKELRAKLDATISIDALEQEVFSHLANFFKRYYQGGDFISMRRYKKDVYAIPYEGEEVKLHWANHDQYYIKTSEYLKNYAFKLGGDKLVKFQLKEANTEQNNNKTQNDQERRFAIFEDLPVEVDGTTLLINFTYEPHKKTVKQDDLTKKSVEIIKANVPVDFTDVFTLAPTESNKQRTLLDKHLNSFVARHTFDYFIHKDLGGFLRRELDFYIKNEVLYIDDINTENEIAFNSQISKIKALKQVANKIILFLEQLENFQKKLWLKKKFVIASNYCITLDRIPTDYYAEILENKAQLEEWKTLFDVTVIATEGKQSLLNEPFLVLDTKFFSEDFKDRLLAEFEDLDEQTNGLLINSENFQALNLLQDRYKECIKTCYIDPPYNTGNDGFIYKDNFKSSSWLTFINDREILLKNLLKSNGVIFSSIDDNEINNYSNLKKIVFGDNSLIQNVAIKRSTAAGFKSINQCPITTKEYLLINAKDINTESILPTYVKTKYALDYDTQIVNIDVNYDKWIFKNLNDVFLEKNGFESWKDAKLKFGNNWKDIRLAFIENYALENFESIVSFKDIHKPSDTIKLIREKSKNDREKVYVFERDNYDNIYFLKGRVITFLKNKIRNIDGENVISEIISDFWNDISWDSIANEGKVELKNGKKPEKLIKRLLDLSHGSSKNEIIIDYFSGSGTTVSVSHKFNNKYIGIEMGEYFNSLILPRIKFTLYGDSGGLKSKQKGGFVKYIVLESYEDTLNNLTLHQTETQQGALALNDKVKEEYLLQYMLDVESQDHLFNLNAFKNPFAYQLKVTENNELVPTTVDLVETFNYLIGLKVKKVERIKEFKLVTGKNLKGDKILVIWRNLEKTNNDDLNRFVEKLDIKVFDGEFDIIYVNGDNNLANFKKEEESWKVRFIEEAFFNKMFDVKDI